MTTPEAPAPKDPTKELVLAGNKAAFVVDMICGNCGKKVFVELKLVPFIDEDRVSVTLQTDATNYAEHVKTDHAELMAAASNIGGMGPGGLPEDP